MIGKDVNKSATLLRASGLVAVPTETVYGLGANALDEAAVARIFSAKERPSFDPLIIHQSSAERILCYVKMEKKLAEEVIELIERLTADVWPGPLTLVLPKSPVIPDLVTAGLDTVAIRVPNHPLTRELLSQLDFPVAAPSANPFGFVSPVTAQHVADQLADRVDYILDGGPCRVGLESTILAFPPEGPTVLRQGGLTIEAVSDLLGFRPHVRTHGSSRPQAPGMLSQHYSPGVPITLLPHDAPAPAAAPATTRFIEFDATDLEEAARRLFPTLRELATEGRVERALIRLLPEVGLGRAINDRLRRAAATRV